MKYYILVLLFITADANAQTFAEVGLSMRQSYGSIGYNYVVNNVSVQRWRMYDINYTKNPYASIMVGYNWKLKPSFELGLAVRHESSIATGNDRGINDLRVTLRWSAQ